MIYVNATQYAKLHGVSKQRIHALIQSGRIPVWKPGDRIYLIDKKLPYPKAGKVGRPTNDQIMKNLLTKTTT
jgi:excisionase family DNA binding protein